MRLPRALAETLHRLFDGKIPLAMGVALSGGGDSVALTVALAEWCKARRNILFAATVNHGLRPEAAEEAAYCSQLCAELDIAHTVLHWTDRPTSGNLQDTARQARRRLLTDWARENELPAIALGHTQDDQAETVLMRLARGSGVDGLAAMSEDRHEDGVRWIRPLLNHSRQSLRDYLTDEGVRWHDDPSNDDTRFDRIKARQALVHLEKLGLTTETLARTAEHMAQARDALEIATLDLARRAMVLDAGDLRIDRAALVAAPAEIRFRLMAHGLSWVSSSPYRPRFRALISVIGALERGRTQTLHGCLVTASKTEFRIMREYSAVELLSVPATEGVWDQRWSLDGPATASHRIAVLGEAGLRQLEEPGDLPRASRIALPAIWDGDNLVAAPIPDQGETWRLQLRQGPDHPFTSILSH
ncbi:MAG: tRNA lysidine(34) synthetase TilS [Pseudomonadota bacterium]